jgi:hypothetical protein
MLVENKKPTEFSLEKQVQWAADTERLLVAALSNILGPTIIDYDIEAEEIVKQRCIKKYGEEVGMIYFINLIANLPKRRPELFPELADQSE